ncbi:hypothetical protein ACIBG0_36120 [Nocardia sp. NPDC050630]|uniref:hypothetical protein n=1 Tax=Nocardia sp. NPDC050630 TaxID=3364321 RepID=UPI0037AB789F
MKLSETWVGLPGGVGDDVNVGNVFLMRLWGLVSHRTSPVNNSRAYAAANGVY